MHKLTGAPQAVWECVWWMSFARGNLGVNLPVAGRIMEVPERDVEVLTLAPVDVALCGNRVMAGVMSYEDVRLDEGGP